MKSFEHIYRVHRLLKQARYPVSFDRLQDELGCSKSSVKRVLRDMRNQLGAPIQTCRDPAGYRYTDQAYELPGLWFGADELHALLTLQHLLNSFQPGLLEGALSPLRSRLTEILKTQGIRAAPLERIRLLNLAARPPGEHLGSVAQAVLRRQRLLVVYRAKTRISDSEREISPQRLLNYRGNWYLDAWCHQATALRTFAIDGLVRIKVLDAAAHEVPPSDLDLELGSSYGIFAGQPTHIAVLRFTAARARWIEGECWHPQQTSSRLADGQLELRVPYRHDEELILDILRYGPDVEVISPATLRHAVAERLKQVIQKYRDSD